LEEDHFRLKVAYAQVKKVKGQQFLYRHQSSYRRGDWDCDVLLVFKDHIVAY